MPEVIVLDEICPNCAVIFDPDTQPFAMLREYADENEEDQGAKTSYLCTVECLKEFIETEF